MLIDKTCKGHNSLLNTDLIFCDIPKVYGENALLFDRGNPSFRVVLQSDVITSALMCCKSVFLIFTSDISPIY